MKISLFFLAMCLFFSAPAMAKKHKKKFVKPPAAILTPSQLFIEAEKAFELGHFSKFEKALPKLTHYPLYPYLLHKKLSREISQHRANQMEVTHFIQKYADSPLSKQLSDQFLALQAHQKNWSHYLTLYEAKEKTEKIEEKEHKYQCYALWATYQKNQDIAELYPALTFWHNGLPQAQSCETIFSALLNQHKLTNADIWNRIEQAFKQKQPDVAKLAATYLPIEEKKLFKIWLKIYKQPNLISDTVLFDLDAYEHDQVPLIKKIMAYAMIRLIRQDVAYASQLYLELAPYFESFSPEQHEIARAFAISLAKKRSPLATDWFDQVPESYQDTEYLSWFIRYALFQQNWTAVLQSIHKLPIQDSQQPRWQYWKARALDALGQKEEAIALFEALFHQQHFYGLLAHHYCKHPLSLTAIHRQNPTKKNSPTLEKPFQEQASIARIKALFMLSRIQQAKREWFYKISLLTEPEKIEAAQFAHEMQWHDLGIRTFSKTPLTRLESKATLRLRFPLAHHPKIMNEATKHDLDPAWIFALTRQESTFIPYAQSPVGAMGLMQLMPKTAQEVATNLKKKHPAKQNLTNPNVNIELGTAYLKYLHYFMQHNPILAIASYNAGPGRIKQWLPPETMAADIWIENIPFEETRHYVQNIITYTGIYQNILGKAVDLENMLPNISKIPS